MSTNLKPLDQRVIVITGATSGIGLATARMAAKADARLVLAARSERALGQLVDEIGKGGAHAVALVADVAQEDEGAPVSVTLIKPTQIYSPSTVNAKNYLASEPQPVPAVYSLDVVASAILRSATKPVRSVFVGGGGVLISLLGRVAPGLTDKVVEGLVIPGTFTGKAPCRARDQSGLDMPTESLSTTGNYARHVARTSLYTIAALHSVATAGVLAGVGLLLRSSLGRHRRPAHILDGRGGRTAKALQIRLEARPGRAADVVQLVGDILRDVRAEPATMPWFGGRLSKRVFGIFERFLDEAGRRAHLSGRWAVRLLARSDALLSKAAEISKLDIIGAKLG